MAEHCPKRENRGNAGVWRTARFESGGAFREVLKLRRGGEQRKGQWPFSGRRKRPIGSLRPDGVGLTCLSILAVVGG